MDFFLAFVGFYSTKMKIREWIVMGKNFTRWSSLRISNSQISYVVILSNFLFTYIHLLKISSLPTLSRIASLQEWKLTFVFRSLISFCKLMNWFLYMHISLDISFSEIILIVSWTYICEIFLKWNLTSSFFSLETRLNVTLYSVNLVHQCSSSIIMFSWGIVHFMVKLGYFF